MKNFKKYMGAIAILAMFFTSCSTEETDILQEDAKATLSFSTILNDMVNNNRQQAELGIPACMDDEPAYVEVVLTGDENVGSMEDPLVINVHPTPIQEDGEDVWFTQESADLELVPGDYVLTYFAVYNEGGDMIWLAPTTGGDLADFVDNPLPHDISLGAGVKKYVDVEVLCFDDRMVNEYGYLFFDIIGKEAFEFCFFANYCDDNGRHYPARFSVDIWLEDGTELYSGMINDVDLTGEDPAASPICLVLPNLSSYDDDEDYIHYSLTLLDFEGVYDAPEMMDPIEGTLSRDDIWANLNDDGETVEYHHARFNCESDDNGGGNGGTQDSDGDGIPDNVDNCPDLANPGQEPDADCDGILDSVDNCPNLYNPGQEPDTDCDGIIDADENVGCENDPDPNCGEVAVVPCLPAPDTVSNCETVEFSQNNVTDEFPYQFMVDGTEVGNVGVSIDGSGDVTITITMDVLNDTYLVDECEVIIGDYVECFDFDNEGTAVMTIEGDYSYGFDLDMRVNVCPVIN